mmetsp:Transcript_13328/g.49492  ORF Transcript_13328/g.49492 Transcript_13328/m.49492 type:complete len:95 (+) Transcript_13328:416-700(+)
MRSRNGRGFSETPGPLPEEWGGDDLDRDEDVLDWDGSEEQDSDSEDSFPEKLFRAAELPSLRRVLSDEVSEPPTAAASAVVDKELLRRLRGDRG